MDLLLPSLSDVWAQILWLAPFVLGALAYWYFREKNDPSIWKQAAADLGHQYESSGTDKVIISGSLRAYSFSLERKTRLIYKEYSKYKETIFEHQIRIPLKSSLWSGILIGPYTEVGDLMVAIGGEDQRVGHPQVDELYRVQNARADQLATLSSEEGSKCMMSLKRRFEAVSVQDGELLLFQEGWLDSEYKIRRFIDDAIKGAEELDALMGVSTTSMGEGVLF